MFMYTYNYYSSAKFWKNTIDYLFNYSHIQLLLHENYSFCDKILRAHMHL